MIVATEVNHLQLTLVGK